MSSTSGKKSRHLFRKFIFFFFLTILGVLLILILVFRFFLPQEEIKLYTEQRLTQALEKPVNIGELQVNPFGSVIIRDVSIGQYTGQKEKIDTLFRVKKIVLKYKFFSLFKRRLWITRVLIDTPEFYLLPESKISEAEDIKSPAEIQSAKKSVKKPDAAALLPFAFLMSSFELKDCTFLLEMNIGEEKTFLSLQGLNLNISKVNLPRNFQRARHWIRGVIQLFTREGSITLRSKNFSHRFRADIDITGAFRALSRWDISGNIKVGRQEWDKAIWPGLSLNIEGRNFTDICTINQASLHTEKFNFIDLAGSILYLKEYDITLSSSSVDLNSFIKTYEKLFSDFGLNIHEMMEIKGFITPIKASIQGRSDSLQVEAESRLNVNKLLFVSDSSIVDQGFLRINAAGFTSLETLKEIQVKTEFGFDSFNKHMNDTMQLKTGVLSGTLTTTLDSQGFPYTGSLHCSLDSLVQGMTELNAIWFSDVKSDPGIENIVFQGGLQTDSIDLTHLPFSGLGIKGRAGLDLTVFSRGGLQNKVELNCRFDSVQYNQESIGKGARTLQANLSFRTDSSWSELVLDSCLMNVDNVLDCNVQGYYLQKKREFNVTLVQATIENAEIITYLPETVSENMELSGYENMYATLQGRMHADTFSNAFTARIDFNNTGINLFPEQIFISDVQGDVCFQGSLHSFTGQGDIVLNTIHIPHIRASSFNQTSFGFKGKVHSFNSFIIDTADIFFPSLEFKGSIKGSLQDPDNGSISIKGGARFEFDAADTVEFVNNILLKGNIDASLQVETYDSSHTGVNVSGHLNAESLAVSSKDRFGIANVQSSVPFSINYDLETQSLSTSQGDPLQIQGDYRNKRSLYQNLFPEIGRLTLESVKILHYQIDRIDTDILCTGNCIQLPWISMDIFGGNIAGELSLDLNSGKLGDITYTITGNANRINSAMISRVKQKKEEKSELDATFKFEGRGLDISEIVDVSGYFHIITMGPDFASNLLSSIDPSGSDRSIKMTKQLINTGWKPGIFSFELRHGYVYPSFNLHQPWFSPVRLPERLEYGRLPLSFFLKRK
ncbi:MAG: hypothetical protein R6V04_16000 [bacterium]